MRKKGNRMWKRLFNLFLIICIIASIQPAYVQASGSYTADWQRWSQGASAYSAMQYGCRVTAYAKMLAEAGYTGFGNPDGFFEWGKGKGYFRASDTYEQSGIGVAPVTYVSNNGGTASLAGRQTLTGNKTTDAGTIMNLINQGYYVVLTCSAHSAYVGRADSISQGTAVILDSWASAKVGPSFQYRNYTQYTFTTANYFRITGNSANNNPQGCLDAAVGGTNTVRVTGWAFDPNAVSQSTEIHVYIGGPAGTGEGHGGIIANICREDVNNVYGVGSYHGFDATINTSLVGTQTVYVYAINIGAGTNQLIGTQTVAISENTAAPTISDVRVTDVNAEGFTVSCRVEDAKGVTKVQFPTWVSEDERKNGMEDWWDNIQLWVDPGSNGTQNGTTWSYRVNVSDHNNEQGFYNTYIHAWGMSGKNCAIYVGSIFVDRTPPVISDVQVVDMDATGYTVTCKVEDAASDVARVQFPTWTTANDQDDLAADWWNNPVCRGTQNGTIWSYRVNVSDHNNEDGFYRTHIYACDAAGNRSSATEVADVYLAGATEEDKNTEEPENPETGNPGTDNLGTDSPITFSIEAFNNLDYTFQTIDGSTVSSKALPSKDVTLLIFGRTTCASTWLTMKSIAESDWVHEPKVSVIYVDIEGADAESVESCIERYASIFGDADLYQYRLGCEKIVFCHDADGKNEEARKMYHMLSGKRGTISLPMTVMVDKNDVVREMLTGYQTADKILPVVNQVIAKGDTADGEDDKKEDDKKEESDKEEETERKPIAVEAENVRLSKASVIWNGQAQKPSVMAKDGQGKAISSADYTVAYSNNKNVGQATATIVFRNNYTGTVKKTFTIKPKGTSITRLTPKKKGFSVKWKKQAFQATGYEIQYSTNSKFRSAKALGNIKVKITSKKVARLKAKKKYYVRIRTYKTVKVNGRSTTLYSGWSKTKKVKTKK